MREQSSVLRATKLSIFRAVLRGYSARARDVHARTFVTMHAPRDAHASDARLPDGVYDAFVVWIDERDDDMFAVDLTVIAGAHKGDVVCVVAPSDVTRASLHAAPHTDALDLVGVPCTLHVVDGAPRLARE
jgi:hypothetical protein